MARHRITQSRGHAGNKALGLLAAALLIFWAGHDPAGAAHLIRHIGQAIASLAQHRHTVRSTRP